MLMYKSRQGVYMIVNSIVSALIGGGLIGVAVTLKLLFNGRVTGISGIVSSSLAKPTRDGFWRLAFLGGLIIGGILMHFIQPEFFANISGRNSVQVILAGLLVGFGTVMGSGCTSGHGVCGISRLSIRSLIATITFMLFGFLAVYIVRFFAGGII